MADRPPPKELIDNLDFFMKMDVLQNEKDWKLLRDLNDLPPEKMLDPKPDPGVQDGK